MELYELVNGYHIGTDVSCAESMFKACNEYYRLGLSEETRKMFSVMGSGMQSGTSCCGAFTVAVGMIGLMTAQEGQTDCDNMQGYEMICELTDRVDRRFGSLGCPILRGLRVYQYEDPCYLVVEEIAKMLESILRENGFPPPDMESTV
ncbi:MAG: oxidoreductase [Lawsonibacter sp.]|jgi:C_GCAxxG_C_C family probable redox protein|nr:oxidoreductase [Lawsonibacter sp.]